MLLPEGRSGWPPAALEFYCSNPAAAEKWATAWPGKRLLRNAPWSRGLLCSRRPAGAAFC